MENELPLGLSRNRTYAPLTPSDLEMLGKRASDMYLQKEASLNDAVSQLAGQHPGISPEQIKRVVEFANQNTFQSIFEKQAGDKNIEFDLADPGVVIRELNDGAKPAVYHPVPSEYGQSPIKTSSAVLSDMELCEIFGVKPETPAMQKAAAAELEGKVEEFLQKNPDPKDPEFHAFAENAGVDEHKMEEAAYGMLADQLRKKASIFVQAGNDIAGLIEKDLAAATSLDAIKRATAFEYPSDSPHNELADTRRRLVKMAEEADYAADANRRMTKEAMNDLTKLVRQEVLSGTNLGEVVHAISTVPASHSWIKTAMQQIVPDLVGHGLNPVQLHTDLLQYQMEKEAAVRIVNPSNPVIQTFASFVKLGSEQPVLDQAVQDVNKLLAETNTAVAHALRAR